MHNVNHSVLVESRLLREHVRLTQISQRLVSWHWHEVGVLVSVPFPCCPGQPWAYEKCTAIT